MVGQPFWQTPWWTHLPEQQQLAALIRRATSGETIRTETQHVWADGTLAWLDFSLKPIVDEVGQVVMLMPEGRDITERKQAELTLQRQVKQEYLLNNLTEDIRQSLDLEAVLVRAVERSRDVLENDRVIVFRFVGHGEGPQTAGPEALPPGQGEVILLVDDDDSMQQALQSLLVNYNYSPLSASSGLEALDL
ncbi:MAG: hypothetical protein DCF32_19820, partial [Leptolyngbya sp.]